MKRRDILRAGGLAVLPVAASAQQPPKILRVGVVSSQPRTSILWRSFLQRMAQLGYREGENFTFDHVMPDRLDEYRTGYRRFANGAVDVILAPGPEVSLQSALALPGTTPIVMVAIDYDPLVRGYVKSLARPEGHATGVMLQQIELAVKRVQLLKDSFADLEAMTVFWDQSSADQWVVTQDAAAKVGVRLAGIELRDPPYDYERPLRRHRRKPAASCCRSPRHSSSAKQAR